LLERSAAEFGMSPEYLKPVAESSPLAQIKNIMGLILQVPALNLLMQKPFNPILG
jgi:hypothetical protein